MKALLFIIVFVLIGNILLVLDRNASCRAGDPGTQPATQPTQDQQDEAVVALMKVQHHLADDVATLRKINAVTIALREPASDAISDLDKDIQRLKAEYDLLKKENDRIQAATTQPSTQSAFH